jgi:ferredoxin--NADP+ reductase
MPDHKYTRQTVTKLIEWVPKKLFSIETTRDPEFNFKAGQFARLGLPAGHDNAEIPTIWRAYSMVTAPAQDKLGFYSIVVPEGEFSPRLAELRPGDSICIDRTAFGFLTIDRFARGGDLWLLATGTGLSAYLSMLQDGNTWTQFDRIILVHGVRTIAELAYQAEIRDWDRNFSSPGPAGAPRAQLTYLPIPTREALPGMPQERITTLIANRQLENLAGRPLDPQVSKVMLCGNPDMLGEARKLLTGLGFAVGRRGNLGNLAVENYW